MARDYTVPDRDAASLTMLIADQVGRLAAKIAALKKRRDQYANGLPKWSVPAKDSCP
jgi:hypothetical protein